MMDKWIKRGYIAAVFFGILIVLISGTFKEDKFEKNDNQNCYVIRDFTYTTEKNEKDPCGVREIRKFRLPDKIDGDEAIMCYTSHQNVQIFCGEERRCTLKASEKNLFGKTSGRQWSKVTLNALDAGKEVTLITIPVYKSIIGRDVLVYLGSEYDVFIAQLRQDLDIMLLAIFVILFGIILVIYSLATHVLKQNENTFWMIGIFSILLGMWKLTDLHIIEFVFRNSVTVSMLPFIMLLLLPIPLTMYMKRFCSSSNNGIWYLVVGSSFVNIWMAYILQIVNCRDFKELLLFSQILLAVSFLTSFFLLLYEWIKKGVNKFVKMTTVCILICLLGMAADVYSYYRDPTNTQMQYSIYGFLIYIVVIIVYSGLKARKLLKIGKKADYYKEMAYTDPLTGFYNRNYLKKKAESDIRKKKKCAFVAFDLNNLKFCNDTYGHEAGDRYIIAGAKIIRSAFGKYGKCYRIGGDEFWVVLHDTSDKTYEFCVKQLEEKVKEFNATGAQPFEMGIAYGMAEYDATVENDYKETMRRADKQMYKKKYQMKD